MANTLTVLFFDLDGTLTDITQRGIDAIYHTVNHFGLRVSRNKVEQLCVETSSYFDVFKKLGVELTEEVEQYWTSAFVKKYRLSMIREGVESTLKDLEKRYRLLCVTSSATLAEVTQELRFFHIDRIFSYVVTRDVAAKHFGLSSLPFLPFHEQRTKLYQCALEIAESNPENTIVIGDMESELKPAKDLGMRTIGLIAHEARKSELKRTSDFLISNITQLQNVLLESHRSTV
jgi:phosphoglycolate phosphatase-like HAD superfamily hydrolase